MVLLTKFVCEHLMDDLQWPKTAAEDRRQILKIDQLNRLYANEGYFSVRGTREEGQVSCFYKKSPETEKWLKELLNFNEIAYSEIQGFLVFQINLSNIFPVLVGEQRYQTFWELLLAHANRLTLKNQGYVNFRRSEYANFRSVLINRNFGAPHEKIVPERVEYLAQPQWTEYRAESFGDVIEETGDPKLYSQKLNELNLQYQDQPVVVDDFVDYGMYTATRKHRERVAYVHQIRIRFFRSMAEKKYFMENSGFVEYQGNKGSKFFDLFGMGLRTIPTLVLTKRIYEKLAELSARQKVIQISSDILFEISQMLEGQKLLAVRTSPLRPKRGYFPSALNVGLNPAVLKSLTYQFGEGFAYQIYCTFISSFAIAVFKVSGMIFEKELQTILELRGLKSEAQFEESDWKNLSQHYLSVLRLQGLIIPEDPWVQLCDILEAFFDLPEQLPVVIQEMKFGSLNSNSGSGVVNTFDTINGLPGINGVFLSQAEACEVTNPSGRKAFHEIKATHDFPIDVQDSLEAILNTIEDFYRFPQNVEFVVQSGKIFVTDIKSLEEFSPGRQLMLKKYLVQKGWLDQTRFLWDMTSYIHMRQGIWRVKSNLQSLAVLQGQINTANSSCGVLTDDALAAMHMEDAVLILDQPDESVFRMIENHSLKGLVLINRHAYDHAAMHARIRNLPSLLINDTQSIAELESWKNREVILDGQNGRLFLSDESDVLESEKEIQIEGLPIDLEKLKFKAAEMAVKWDIDTLKRRHQRLKSYLINAKRINTSLCVLNLLTHELHLQLDRRLNLPRI